ncbi:MAG: hypothetical protein IJ774_14415 [Selenomonadaceae bacterium]|nr:hypothetical protein [Selenomonadaceae bacterium]
MRQVFFATIFALVLTVQNFCGAAATIDEAIFNGDDNLKYPIVHTGDTSVDAKINRVIDGIMNNFVMGVRTDRRERGIDINVMNTNYAVMCNDAGGSDILSILLTDYKYGRNGPAHPLTKTHTLNFKLSTGELLDTNYLAQKISLEDISRKLEAYNAASETAWKLSDGALPLKRYPEGFYFDENMHLHVLFQRGEIAHFGRGVLDFDMDD